MIVTVYLPHCLQVYLKSTIVAEKITKTVKLSVTYIESD